MARAEHEARPRGCRPRLSDGRITVRLPQELLDKLRREPNPSEVVRIAVAVWYAVFP